MRVPQHIVNRRRAELAAWMQQQGHVSLQAVCVRFEISEATARRDLAALEADQQIVRTYGGALSEYNQRFASFRDRLASAPEGKRSIAERARQRIRSGITIFLDAGTTLFAIAEAIAAAPPESLVVVTNNLPVAERLAGVPGLRLMLLGGELLARQSTLVGEAAIASLALYRIDLAFLGVEAANTEGLWNSQEEIAAFQRDVARRSAVTCYCADATKLGRAAPAFLAPWSQVAHFITDASAAALRKHRLPASSL